MSSRTARRKRSCRCRCENVSLPGFEAKRVLILCKLPLSWPSLSERTLHNSFDNIYLNNIVSIRFPLARGLLLINCFSRIRFVEFVQIIMCLSWQRGAPGKAHGYRPVGFLFCPLSGVQPQIDSTVEIFFTSAKNSELVIATAHPTTKKRVSSTIHFANTSGTMTYDDARGVPVTFGGVTGTSPGSAIDKMRSKFTLLAEPG
jgi:hypothetical protein